MQNPRKNGRGHRPLPRRLSLAALLVCLPLAACDLDSLLDISDPDVADPGNLNGPTALPAFRAGAIGDFAAAFDATDASVTYSGMLADEFINSETFPTRIEIDIRNMDEENSNLETFTRNLYQAHTAADEAVRAFQEFGPDEPGLAEVYAMRGFTYILFGELFCSGVPFSRLNEQGQFEYGGQETTAQTFQRALASGDSALDVAEAAGDDDLANLARVLRGRALLNLNQPAQAAAAVADVPDDFEYTIFHSENTVREYNGIYVFNVINERISVANNEGGNGLPFRANFTAGDPRTPWVRTPGTDTGFDTSTPQYDQRKYLNRSAGTVLASGIEARLIEAEAAHRAGNFAGANGALQIINDLRATIDLGPVADPGTAAGRVDLIFRERAYWMWLTAHRLGDLRRLIRQYGRTEDQVFPTGAYHKSAQGGVYGDDVNFPIVLDERNNPEFADFPSNVSLCLDRNA